MGITFILKPFENSENLFRYINAIKRLKSSDRQIIIRKPSAPEYYDDIQDININYIESDSDINYYNEAVKTASEDYIILSDINFIYSAMLPELAELNSQSDITIFNSSSLKSNKLTPDFDSNIISSAVSIASPLENCMISRKFLAENNFLFSNSKTTFFKLYSLSENITSSEKVYVYKNCEKPLRSAPEPENYDEILNILSTSSKNDVKIYMLSEFIVPMLKSEFGAIQEKDYEFIQKYIEIISQDKFLSKFAETFFGIDCNMILGMNYNLYCYMKNNINSENNHADKINEALSNINCKISNLPSANKINELIHQNISCTNEQYIFPKINEINDSINMLNQASDTLAVSMENGFKKNTSGIKKAGNSIEGIISNIQAEQKLRDENFLYLGEAIAKIYSILSDNN